MDAPCQFGVNQPKDLDDAPLMFYNSNDHGMRSAEYAVAAFLEGYAHFFAAVAMNDPSNEDGVFRYYKDINTTVHPEYIPFVKADSLVSLLGGEDPDTLGGANRWVDTECQNDWGGSNEIASEIDWMRFWWRFSTEQSGSQPTLPQVAAFVGYTQIHYPWETAYAIWQSFVNALNDEPAGIDSTRFAAMNDEQGVYDGQ